MKLKNIRFMKRLIICLVALAFTACEFEFSINKQRIEIYDLSIECIKEEVITIPGSAPATMNWHTFSCQGVVGGYEGDFYIQILYNTDQVAYTSPHMTMSGNRLPFIFTFDPKKHQLDKPNLCLTVEFIGGGNKILASTTVFVTKHPVPQTEEYTNVPYMEYSLWGTQCEWQLPNENNNIIIVNSDEELARYIQSESGENYPAVDFDKYTMIIAHGGVPRGIYQTLIENLQQVSDTEYRLNIDVVLTKTDAPELWTKAILVDKWDRLSMVNLYVETIELIN